MSIGPSTEILCSAVYFRPARTSQRLTNEMEPTLQSAFVKYIVSGLPKVSQLDNFYISV